MQDRPIRGLGLMGAVFGSLVLPIAAATAAARMPAESQRVAAALDSLVAGSEGVAAAGVVTVRIDRRGREYAVARGCAQFAADGASCARALTLDDWMRVASVSKLFAAVGALKLVDAGALQLDADVSDVLGYSLRNPAFPEVPITLRQLLSHTSSLRDGERYNIASPGTLRDLLAEGGRFDGQYPPGKYFNYANINFGALGALIERASGKRFDVYMRESVLQPAGIRAGYNWSGLEDLPLDRVAVLYRKRVPDTEDWQPAGPWQAQVDAFAERVRGPAVPPDYVLGSNPTLFAPQGGLRVRPIDVARFVRLLFDPRMAKRSRGARVELKPETRALLCQPVYTASGGEISGNSEGSFYTAFGVGAQPKTIAAREWCGHFAEAYGLKGGALFDARRRETLVYFLTGFANEPPLGDKRYPGLDALEAAAVDISLESR